MRVFMKKFWGIWFLVAALLFSYPMAYIMSLLERGEWYSFPTAISLVGVGLVLFFTGAIQVVSKLNM